jgi:hypothetical protein
VGKKCVKGEEDKGDTRRGVEHNCEDEGRIPVPQFWGFLQYHQGYARFSSR